MIIIYIFYSIIIWSYIRIVCGELLKKCFNFFPNFFNVSISVDFLHKIFGFKMLDYGHGVIHVSVEPFLQRFFIVISSSRPGCSSFKTSFKTSVLGTIQKQNEFQIDFVSNGLIPTRKIIFISWKSVNQKIIFLRLLLHVLILEYFFQLLASHQQKDEHIQTFQLFE